MARAVLNKRDELMMRNDRIVFVENGADGAHNFDVLLLISSTDVIGFANPSLGKDKADRLTMIRDKQPVADVLPSQLHGTIRHIEEVLKRYDPDAADLGGETEKAKCA